MRKVGLGEERQAQAGWRQQQQPKAHMQLWPQSPACTVRLLITNASMLCVPALRKRAVAVTREFVLQAMLTRHLEGDQLQSCASAIWCSAWRIRLPSALAWCMSSS